MRTLVALGTGAMGAMVGMAAGLPLPFMLGAMLATTAAAMAGLPMAMPKALRNCVAPVLGVMFGSAIELNGLPAPTTVFALSALVTAHLAVTICLGWLYFRWIGLDVATSYFAAVPGNFSDMMLFAEKLGADLRAVAVVHTVRLVAAVSALSFGLRYLVDPDLAPFVRSPGGNLTLTDIVLFIICGSAGYMMARLIRLPAPQLFGPLFATVLVQGMGWSDAAPPGWTIAVAQIVLGTFAGVRFAGMQLREVWRLVLASLAWCCMLLTLVTGSAALAAFLLDLQLVTPLVAFSPGGAAELNLLALSAGLSIALVSVIHLVRMLLTLIIGPAIVSVLVRQKGCVPDR